MTTVEPDATMMRGISAVSEAKATFAEGVGQTDYRLTVLAVIHGHKVRIVIERKFYSDRSSATADVWSPAALRWNTATQWHPARFESRLPEPASRNLNDKQAESMKVAADIAQELSWLLA